MRPLGKFLSLPPADRRLLLRAALLLGAIRLGLSLFAFRTLRRLLARAAHRRGDRPTSPERVAWAVASAGRYMPGATCLVQALAAQLLLEREGQPACLRIGVARTEPTQLQAHAWVESQGKIVFGAADLERYTPLAAGMGARP